MIAAALCGGGHAADTTLLDRWREAVHPELGTTEEALRRMRAEVEGLPVADSQPDFSYPGYRSQSSATQETEKWVQIDLGRVTRVDDIVLVPAVLPSPDGTAAAVGFPLRFRVETSLTEDFGQRETVADFTGADFPDPGAMPVLMRNVARDARCVRVTAEVLRGEPDNYFLALGELVASSANRNVAQGAPVQALDALASPRWSLQGLTDGTSVLGKPVERRSMPTNGYHGRVEQQIDAAQWVQVDLGASLPLEEVRLVPARPVDYQDTVGFGFPARFKVEAADDATFTHPVMIADYSPEDFPNPGDRRVVIPAHGQTGRFVRVTAIRLWPRSRFMEEFVFALGELEVISGGGNVAREKPVSESAPLAEDSPAWAPAYLVDGIAPREGVGSYAEWLSTVARGQLLSGEIKLLERKAVNLREAAETRLAWLAGLGVAAVAATGIAIVWLGRKRQRTQTLVLRSQIARDLHDEIGSNLSSIAILSELGADPAADPDTMRHDMAEIRRVATQTADSMHDIVWLISPGDKTAGDLAGRLRDTAGLLLAGLEWTMQVDLMDGKGPLSIAAQRDLFLIFKEALHNIRRHSGAQHITISLTRTDRILTLRVGDDGCGYDAGSVKSGHGLPNMAQRSLACGGTLRTVTAPGCGTTLTLAIPLRK